MDKCLKNFSAQEIQLIEQNCQRLSLGAGQVLVEEGQPIEHIYVIESGHVEALKTAKAASTRACRIALLGPGETIGDIGFTDGAPSPAKVQTTEPTVVRAYKISELETKIPDFRKKALEILALPLAHKLRNILELNFQTLESQHKTIKDFTRISSALLNTATALCIYIWLLHFAIAEKHLFPTTTPVTFGILFVFFIMLCFVIIGGKFDPQELGLTFNGWRASLYESLKWTAGVMLVITLLKAILIYTIPNFHNEPLFHPYAALHDQHRLDLLTGMAALYSVIAIVQELLARGFVQHTIIQYFKETSLLKLFESSALVIKTPSTMKITNKAKWQGIFYANVMFSAMHLHISYTMAAVVFLPGLLWGWLYSRHKTIIGVCVSHIIIGIWSGFILGFNFLFH